MGNKEEKVNKQENLANLEQRYATSSNLLDATEFQRAGITTQSNFKATKEKGIKDRNWKILDEILCVHDLKTFTAVRSPVCRLVILVVSYTHSRYDLHL